MITRHFQKKPAYWIALFLCVFIVGRALISPSDEPTDSTRNGYVGTTGLDKRNFARDPFFGPISVLVDALEYVTFNRSSRTVALDRSGEVTASWYGPRFHNRLTASGKRFDMYKNTLAHKTLPLGTIVRLVNPDNGKSAVGVVNDRGPYIEGRDVDVSYAIAKQLGFVKKGVTKLDIEKI